MEKRGADPELDGRWHPSRSGAPTRTHSGRLGGTPRRRRLRQRSGWRNDRVHHRKQTNDQTGPKHHLAPRHIRWPIQGWWVGHGLFEQMLLGELV